MKARLLTVALLATLAACMQYSLVEAKKHKIGEFYSVASEIRWNKWTEGKIEYWTIDGPALQSLLLYKGIKDGEPLRTVRGKDKLPKFSSDMKASEVMEFVVDSFSNYALNNVEASNLRPSMFGSKPGYRFDLTYQSSEGLEFDGIAIGTVADDILYMIIYTGARAHYFPKYKGQVEQIISSIETI